MGDSLDWIRDLPAIDRQQVIELAANLGMQAKLDSEFQRELKILLRDPRITPAGKFVVELALR